MGFSRIHTQVIFLIGEYLIKHHPHSCWIFGGGAVWKNSFVVSVKVHTRIMSANSQLSLLQTLQTHVFINGRSKVTTLKIVPIRNLNMVPLIIIIKLFKNYLLVLVWSPKGILDSFRMHFLDFLWRNAEFWKCWKISLPEMDPRLSQMKIKHFRQESFGVIFSNMLQLGVDTLYTSNSYWSIFMWFLFFCLL